MKKEQNLKKKQKYNICLNELIMFQFFFVFIWNDSQKQNARRISKQYKIKVIYRRT